MFYWNTDLGEAIALGKNRKTLKQEVVGTSLEEKVRVLGDRLTEFDTDAAESVLGDISKILQAWKS